MEDEQFVFLEASVFQQASNKFLGDRSVAADRCLALPILNHHPTFTDPMKHIREKTVDPSLNLDSRRSSHIFHAFQKMPAHLRLT